MRQRQVSFTEAVKMALTVNYCNFSGRSSRSEFWWFVLFNFLLGALITCIFGSGTTGECVSGVVSLLLLLPGLGLCVRRLHDIDKSGWWFFINFIPLIGTIWFIVLMCRDSMHTPNQYGPEPNVD